MMNHPEPVQTALLQCRSILEKIECALATSQKDKRYIYNYYKATDTTNSAARAALRKCYRCNSDHPKYKQGEIKGLYVLAWEDANGKVTPFYVGISRTIIRRLRQHVFGTSDSQATLAYLMSRSLRKTPTSKMKRSLCPVFKEHREDIQKKLRTARFAIAEVEDDYTLYLAEAYIAKALSTEYNSFRTH